MRPNLANLASLTHEKSTVIKLYRMCPRKAIIAENSVFVTPRRRANEPRPAVSTMYVKNKRKANEKHFIP